MIGRLNGLVGNSPCLVPQRLPMFSAHFECSARITAHSETKNLEPGFRVRADNTPAQPRMLFHNLSARETTAIFTA